MSVAISFYQELSLKIKSIAIIQHCKLFHFCSSTLTHNNIGFDFKLFPEVKLSGEHLETVFKYKNGDDVREIAKINITLQKKGGLYNLRGLDF